MGLQDEIAGEVDVFHEEIGGENEEAMVSITYKEGTKD